MNYAQARDYIDSFVDYEKLSAYPYSEFKLERARALLDMLGRPQNEFKSVHIAGTKGKGSTCAFIHSILKETGFKAGLYTSPHLVDFRERIRINSRLIQEAELCELLNEIQSVMEKITASTEFDKPTFFELYTTLAFLFFAREKVDIAVIETGLGGRLDATNVLTPEVVCMTPVSFDHTDILGDRLGSIAKEKCGIIKGGVSVISAPQEEEAMGVIRKICREKNARLYIVGDDLKIEDVRTSSQDTKFSVKGLMRNYPNLATSLLGAHQAVNAASAIAVAEILALKEIDISCDDIINGIRNVRWHGRLEVINEDPLIILDGAQNRASAAVLAQAIRDIFASRKTILILGISQGKDVKGIADELASLADKIILTKAHNSRALAPSDLKKEFSNFKGDIESAGNLKDAIDIAKSKAGNGSLILITGSLYLVGEAITLLGGNDGLN